ncbi:hypothetical protein [Streptomyces huiliensis]|uniref:hypothetical protein n=1 Tax=Streptomyces huiliensis TaxID=2876027 RepID=UPI001CBA9309|nr:hypothetical protein [Streptomyces huiliensis]MBZ4318319.1 hypothetical protein [Streptomyces huiliensis]
MAQPSPARRPRRALPVLLVSVAASSLLLTSCGTDHGPRDDLRRPGTASDATPGDAADDVADDDAYDEAEEEDDEGADDDLPDAEEADEEDDEAADPGDDEEEEDAEDAETSESAYDDGFDTGQDVLEARGKGAAVREVVWGGCEKRARESRTAYPDAWTRGCRKGVQTFRGN